MGNLPAMPFNLMEILREYKIKSGLSNAQIATALSDFGWTWNETHIADLLAGKVKPTGDEVIFFTRYFIGRYHVYCIS